MSSRQVNMAFALVLFAAVSGFIPTASSVEQAEITEWDFTGILRNFGGPPDQSIYRIGAPEIVKMDTSGAELLFRITPVSDPGCTQVFKVGWTFERDIRRVREEDSFGVQLFNRPQGDGSIGYRECYLKAKQRAYDGGLLILAFNPSSANTLLTGEYAKYHEGSAQYMFTKTTDIIGIAPVGPGQHVQDGLDGFFVQDSPYRNSPGYINALHGSLSFHISKGGLFSYSVSYLFDAYDKTKPPPVDALGREWQESDSGWKGSWIRRGDSNIFDARWRSGPGAITAELSITISGSQVTIKRSNSSDGNDCDYSGVLASDGVTVSGFYTCTRYPGPFTWKAKIRR